MNLNYDEKLILYWLLTDAITEHEGVTITRYELLENQPLIAEALKRKIEASFGDEL